MPEPERKTLAVYDAPLVLCVLDEDTWKMDCDPVDEVSIGGEVQLVNAEGMDDMSKDVCYTFSSAGLSIGTSVMSSTMAVPPGQAIVTYESPFDEEGFGTIGSFTYGEIIDGPVCRDNILMWKVQMRVFEEGEPIVGWMFEGNGQGGYYLIPIPK
jgi:hypothetical protein